MNEKHTPAPWTISGSGIVTNDGQVAVLAGDRRVALVDAPEAEETPKKNRWRIESPEREANAHLIAAAPDLLAALKDAIRSSRKDFKVGPDGDRQHQEAYAEQFAAVAKAEGRS